MTKEDFISYIKSAGAKDDDIPEEIKNFKDDIHYINSRVLFYLDKDDKTFFGKVNKKAQPDYLINENID